MENKIKFILINPFDRNHNSNGEVIEINPKLDEYYRLLDCKTIDVTQRYIGGRLYDIIVDDEGLLKEPNKIKTSCINPASYIEGNTYRCNDFLVGKVLISKYDEENEKHLTLTDEDIKNIQSNIKNNVLIMYYKENEEAEINFEAHKHELSKSGLLNFFSETAIEHDLERCKENNENHFVLEEA